MYSAHGDLFAALSTLCSLQLRVVGLRRIARTRGLLAVLQGKTNVPPSHTHFPIQNRALSVANENACVSCDNIPSMLDHQPFSTAISRGGGQKPDLNGTAQ